MRHLVGINELSTADIDRLIRKAQDIVANPAKYQEKCRHKKLAALFYEASTRTRLSFEAAMYELGGNVIGFSSADSSSATKGETVADTIRMVSSYADICVIRHPKEGSALVASKYSKIPVINAGDGGHQHPTQTLTDMFTINTYKGSLDNLNIGLCGDLKFGRTVHSLVECMSRYPNNKFILVSPKELRVPDYIREMLIQCRIDFVETTDFESHISEMDILYMTRVQRERFFNEEDYIRLKDRYILDKEKLNLAKKDLAVLHPLPRVNEISADVDNDKRALYFEQAKLGKYIRMALIMEFLEVE